MVAQKRVSKPIAKKQAKQLKKTITKAVVKMEHKVNAKRVRSMIRPTTNSLATTIAGAFALPGTCPNLRIRSTIADSMPTACTSLHSLATVKSPTAGTNYGAIIPQGTSFMAIFRDPLRSLVQYTTNVPAYTYNLQFRDLNGAVSSSMNLPAAIASVDTAVDFLYATSLTVGAPHGPVLYPGLYQERSYFWLDFNATITLTQTVIAAATVTVLAFTGDEDEVASSLFAAGTWSYTQTAPAGAYLRLLYLAGTAVANTISAVIAGSNDSFAHISLPNIHNHLPQLTKARVNAVSLMASPVASLLNRGGTITGGNIEGGVSWNSAITTTALTQLPQGNYDERDFAKGMYTFLRPSSIDELSMQEYATFDNLSNLVPSSVGFPLKTNFRYAAFVLVSDVVGTTAPGLEYLRTANWDLEFQTPDQWFENHRPPGKYSDVEEALYLLETVPMFHENPLHFADIKNALRGGYNFMRKNGRAIASAFSRFFPHFSTPATVAGEIFNVLPEI